MNKYDFNALNDKEFEVMVSDLLAKRENCRIDRYKSGKDGGIDGSFLSGKKTEVIIQCKHWIKTGLTALLNELEKKEKDKVNKIQPSRYIFVTSLGLSKVNKNKIKQIFSPFIKSPYDILGEENLTDLLKEFPEVENNHYKLWLTSANVLKNLYNNALVGRSTAKRDEIVEKSKVYVRTSNHAKANEKLKNHHSVIITGEAGIGKTTLADQLCFDHIGNGFELCVIEEAISEAEDIWSKDKRQIFYFDDFLGSNYLAALENRQDSKVISFISRIKNDKLKRFVLTSRTTVLSSGKRLSDRFDINAVHRTEHEITITSLTVNEKAFILYNHIWHGKLKKGFIREIYKNKRYREIVLHKNFNPRLIEFITNKTRLNDSKICPKNFWNYIEDSLDNPQSIWEHTFDEQIDELTRIIVCLVVFNDGDISGRELRKAFYSLCLSEGHSTKATINGQFNRTIKFAVGCVLNRTVSGEDQVDNYSLFNPSVADFVLGRYLSDPTSLSSFYFHLNTKNSLKTLLNLKTTNELKDEAFNEVLNGLASSKITIKNLEDNQKYCLSLCKIIIEKEKITQSISQQLLSVAGRVEGLTIDPEEIEAVCVLLLYCYNLDQGERFGEIISAFIISCLERDIDHEHYLSLEGLARKLDEPLDDENLNIIRQAVIEYWKDVGTQLVGNDEVISGLYTEEEEDEAHDMVVDYLDDQLFSFEFSNEEINQIAYSIDIPDLINDNRNNAEREEFEYESWKEHRDRPAANNDFEIIEGVFRKT